MMSWCEFCGKYDNGPLLLWAMKRLRFVCVSISVALFSGVTFVLTISFHKIFKIKLKLKSYISFIYSWCSGQFTHTLTNFIEFLS